MGSLQGAQATRAARLQAMVEMYTRMLQTLPFGRARGYSRLNMPARRKKVRVARLGKLQRAGLRGSCRQRLPRLRLLCLSPFLLMAKLRDMYVRLLQAAASKIALSEGVITIPGISSELGYGFSPSPPPFSIKAHEQELDKILQLYLSRTRSPLAAGSAS